MEKHIRSYTASDAGSLLDFISKRVIGGVVSVTERSLKNVVVADNKSSSQNRNNTGTLLRQWVARRRLHWIATRITAQLNCFREILCLSGRKLENNDVPPPNTSNSEDRNLLFRKGMFVYINGWEPPEDARPAFFCLASIDSGKQLPSGEWTYTVALEGNKYISNVPEAVLTCPTEEEISSSSRRLQMAWRKWKEREELPQKLRRMLDVLKKMRWDESHNDIILSKVLATGCNSKEAFEKKLFDVVHEELSEEALYALSLKKFLLNPYDRADWCPLSTSLLRTLLRHFTICSLSKEVKSARFNFFNALLKSASEASNIIRSISENESIDKGIFVLAFKCKQGQDLCKDQNGFLNNSTNNLPQDPYVITADSNALMSPFEGVRTSANKMVKSGTKVHVQWYIIRQVITVVDSMASLIQWTPLQENTDAGKRLLENHYSLRKVCDKVGVDLSTVQQFLFNQREGLKGKA